MSKSKKKHNSAKPAWFALIVLVGLGACITWLLQGADVALLNPKGLIARAELNLIVFTMLLLLVAAVPTLIFLYFFAWEYRESNHKATYDPDTRHGKFFVSSLWIIPSIIVILLALVMWPAAHQLEPKKTIVTDTKPLKIQVIALRWKWLFIYPEQNIATVNFVQIPVDTPVQFDLTADETPMSSFWIPHLGGQLYAMTGHVNRLNLLADEIGDYPGSSAEINGAGFAGMKFTARASSAADFAQWLLQTRQTQKVLDSAEYEQLLKPSENNSSEFYTVAEAGLYDKMLMKYMGSHDHQPETYEAAH
jgi:cytochrome o ubiquinol oxidase subunit 2